MGKETAEQKLLKVIESTEAEVPADAAAASAGGDDYAQEVAKSVKSSGVSLSIPNLLEGLLAKLKGGTAERADMGFGLRELNMAFLALCVLLVMFFVFDVMRGVNYSGKELNFKVPKQVSELPKNLIPQFADIAAYLNIVSNRNIFQPFEKKIVEDELADLAPETKKIQERTQELKLVGVSWLDSPDTATALIENTTTGITYFLKTGDIVNEVTIKEIYADSVVVGFGQEELNLNL